jgi:hypothetical protein
MTMYQRPGSSKWVQKDHPHEIISPHIMRFDEIREWLKVLAHDPQYGWTEYGGRAGLEYALGFTGKCMIVAIERGRWIFPWEQVRLTSRINDIIEGRIVPKRFDGRTVRGVYCDPPQPPVVKAVKSVRMQAIGGQLKLLGEGHRVAPPLPDFRHAFERAPYWNPDKKRARKSRPEVPKDSINAREA